MRFERLVIEAGSTTFNIDLHPRLTVIAGVGQLERDALVAELLGALGGTRTGVHVEAVEDTGRRLAVFRPNGARGRVVDVDRASDVTAEFADEQGRIDLLRRIGVDINVARRKLRFDSADLDAASHGAQIISRLAGADQAKLWAAAETLLANEAVLQSEAEVLGSSPEDAEIIERVEERHRDLEDAQATYERIRQMTLVFSGCATIGATGALLAGVQSVAIGIILVALVAMIASIMTRNRAQQARDAEEAALADAGAQSYLGFHLQRVNGMLSSDTERRRLTTANDTVRQAREAWKLLAGDTPVAWALEHHEEIAGAARVRIDISAHAKMSADDATSTDDTTDLARVLVARLTELRRLGTGRESLPLVLDNPFAGLEKTTKPALLELLSHSSGSSGSPQLVYMTDDEDVATWARLEALTGTLAIIEPGTEPSGVDRSGRPNLIQL